MNVNPLDKKDVLPQGVVLEKPAFVPRMVMTEQLQIVVREVLSQWRNRDVFKPLIKYGIRPLDRLLFHGPPGNGKTMACYWMARELDIPIYRVLCQQLSSAYVGESEKLMSGVLDYFNKRTSPAILLWDEVEAIFIDRAKAGHSTSARVDATCTAIMLQSLDRWQSPTLMILATNLPNRLDEALLSRIEARLEFIGPTQEQCEQMIEYWRELLTDHGGDEWGPQLVAKIRDTLPVSFRELTQAIHHAAREWTAAKFRRPA